VSFTLQDGLQVDVRLPGEGEFWGRRCFILRGRRKHNVAFAWARANDMGYTLNEYQLATLGAEKHVAGADGGGDLHEG